MKMIKQTWERCSPFDIADYVVAEAIANKTAKPYTKKASKLWQQTIEDAERLGCHTISDYYKARISDGR